MIFGLLLVLDYQTEQIKCSNAIFSEVYEPIGFKFYMRHPGVGPYQIYGNYDFWSVIIDV